jgi:hypothetical protein
MMSEERYLLMRAKVLLECVDTAPLQDQADLIIKDIQELLAQSEKEEEPVAWMQDSVELYVLEEKSAIRGYVIPLYTAPPRALTPREALTEYKRGYARAELDLKREPLGLEIMDVCGTEDYREGFKDGALYAEKCHDIGGE